MQANEIYCRSCGEIIKQNAEICPECGVRNAAYQPSAGAGRGGAGSRARQGGTAGGRQGTGGQQGATTQQASRQEARHSEPSDSWVYGVLIGTVLWFVVAILQFRAMAALGRVIAGAGPGAGPPGGAAASALRNSFFQSPVVLVAWILLAVSLHFDTKYVKINSDYDVSKGAYLGLVILAPFLNIILFTVALIAGANAFIAGLAPLLVVIAVGYYLKKRKDAL